MIRHALGEALRSSLRVEQVHVSATTRHHPGAPGSSRLSIAAADGAAPLVHLERTEPFDAVDERIAREVVHLVTGLVGTWHDHADRAAAYVEQVMDALDAMVGATIEERLSLVASRAAAVFAAVGWSVCFLDRGEAVSVRQHWPVGTAGQPDHRGAGRRADCEAVLAMASVEARSAFEGGSSVLTVDGVGDHAGRPGSLGPCTLLAAGGYDVDALQWMVCVVGDGAAADLWVARAAVSAAVQAALGFPRAPSGRR